MILINDLSESSVVIFDIFALVYRIAGAGEIYRKATYHGVFLTVVLSCHVSCRPMPTLVSQSRVIRAGLLIPISANVQPPAKLHV
jgi:hypothetical protein